MEVCESFTLAIHDPKAMRKLRLDP
jgi:hypothetical protein